MINGVFILTQLTLMCLEYIKEMFIPNVIWHSYFWIPRQSFYGKRAKSLEKFFFPANFLPRDLYFSKFQIYYVSMYTWPEKLLSSTYVRIEILRDQSEDIRDFYFKTE